MATVRGWIAKYGQHRIERELQDYQDPPELRPAPFFRRRPRGDHPQVFRACAGEFLPATEILTSGGALDP